MTVAALTDTEIAAICAPMAMDKSTA